MKNYPHIRFWLFQLAVGILFLISIPTYWLTYYFRQQIRINKKYWGFYIGWLFLNDTKDNDYGADWWLKEKGITLNEDSNVFKRIYYAYRWSVFRNPCWNFQLLFKPKQGEKSNIDRITNYPETYSIWTWRNKHIKGKQYVKWTVNGVKYFRYSFTNKWLNVMYGYVEIKMILKVRIL